MLCEPPTEADRNKDGEEGNEDSYNPQIGALACVELVGFGPADILMRVTVVAHAFVRVCASIADALIAFTHNCVRAITLRTARCGLIFAVFIHFTLLVAVEEVRADIGDTAP